MSGLRCLVYSEDDSVKRHVMRVLGTLEQIVLLPAVPNLRALGEVLRTSEVDLLYVDLGREPAALLELLELQSAALPALLFGGPRDDAEVLLRAMRLHPLEFYVDHELGRGLPALLDRLARERAPAQLHGSGGGTIAVAGAKGGVGTTLITCELAAALQRLGQRVVVVDLNLHGGDAALHFDLSPRYTLADLAKKGESLDDAFMRSVLATHVGGVRVLAAPQEPESAALIGTTHVERSLALLSEQFDWVLIDLPVAWEHVGLRALHCSDLILIVATPEVPALTHARRQLETLQRFGAPEDRVRVVLNRQRSDSALSGTELQEGLGRDIDATIPHDERTALTCVNDGKLLYEVDPRGRLQLAIDSLADRVFHWTGASGTPERAAPTLLHRLRHYVVGN